MRMSDNSSFELRSAISLRPEFRSQFAGRADRSGGRCAGILSASMAP